MRILSDMNSFERGKIVYGLFAISTPPVKHCSGIKGFSIMLARLILTVLVRLVLGMAYGG